jgi:hypothetical protein
MASLQIDDTETSVAQGDMVVDIVPTVIGAAVHQTSAHFRYPSVQPLMIGFIVTIYTCYAAHIYWYSLFGSFN